MRKLSILFLAFGIGTLVACGGSVEVTTGDDKAEEAGGDEKAEEGGADEAEEGADEGGDEAEEGGDEAAGTVCCKFTNPKGEEVKKELAKDMCDTKSGEAVDATECAAAGGGGGGGGGGKTGKRGKN